MKARKPDLKSLVNAVTKDRHSPLYIAMAENYDVISEAFAKRRPNWNELVVGFAEMGLLAGDGKPASVQTAQQTWYRVRREKGSRRLAKPVALRPVSPPPMPSTKPGEIASGVRPAVDLTPPPSAALPNQDPTALLASLRNQVNKRSGR